MAYSNILDLDQFFWPLHSQHYVIIKNQHFPNYFSGCDIDIICQNKKQFTASILETGNSYLKEGFEIEVTETSPTHLYIDFLLEKKIELRFDINELDLPLKKVHLNKDYYYSLLLNKIPITRRWKDEEYFIFVPSPEDDLILRYIEYNEYFSSRPDKIKHLDFILEKLRNNEEKREFLDKLHKHIKHVDLSNEANTSPQSSSRTLKKISEFFQKERRDNPKMLWPIFYCKTLLKLIKIAIKKFIK